LSSVDRLRVSFSFAIISVLWLNLVLLMARYCWLGAVDWTASGATLAVVAAATATWWADRTGTTTRLVTSAALSMTVIMLVYSFAGHDFQVDLHMYFFATLAITTGWCDWRALLAGAGTTLVHHILLNFLIPAAVYPGGPDLARLALHTLILIAELGVLSWIADRLTLSFEAADAAVVEAQSNTAHLRALMAEQQRMEASKQTLLKNQTEETEQFVARMSEISNTFGRTAQDLADAAETLSQTASETSHQAEIVSGAARDASGNVLTAATSTEEMSASIRDIAGEVARSSDIANVAAVEAASTEANVRALSEAASKIGEVIDLINSIAGQTNLLALNASIEAARAGEAGRGFAVVALEVKQLAGQTAKATEEIGSKIAEIQSATSRTVGSIDKIVGTVAQIRQISQSIASAMTQQGAATNEISACTQLAARGTQEVTGIIATVGAAATRTGSAAGELRGISGNLSTQASELQREVSAHVQRLRAA
jgi:methyl-accepting chemotaxis protein